MIRSSAMPESWCSPSIFWVMTQEALPLVDQRRDRAVAAIGLRRTPQRVALELAPPGLAPRLFGGDEIAELDRLLARPDSPGAAEVRDA